MTTQAVGDLQGQWVRVKPAGAMQHWGQARLLRIDRGEAVILPANHRREERVAIDRLKPWVSRNAEQASRLSIISRGLTLVSQTNGQSTPPRRGRPPKTLVAARTQLHNGQGLSLAPIAPGPTPATPPIIRPSAEIEAKPGTGKKTSKAEASAIVDGRTEELVGELASLAAAEVLVREAKGKVAAARVRLRVAIERERMSGDSFVA